MRAKNIRRRFSERGCVISMLAVLLVVFSLWSCSRADYPGKVETLKIGVPPLEQNALLYVADHGKFFVKNGLDLVIKDYDTGVTAINAMSKGEVDIAGAAEFPFVRAIFQKEKIVAIGCDDKFENDYIVGRKDRGIKKIADLKGKRIGVALKTINEFYLGRFLALNGVDMGDVVLVDLAPPAMAVTYCAGARSMRSSRGSLILSGYRRKSKGLPSGRPKAVRRYMAF